jgi:hypothetical protein
MNDKVRNLVIHILAMKDDAHFNDHPEWSEIIKEAEEVAAAIVEKKPWQKPEIKSSNYADRN